MGFIASLTFFLEVIAYVSNVQVKIPVSIKTVGATTQVKLSQHHRESAHCTVSSATDAFNAVSCGDDPLSGHQSTSASTGVCARIGVEVERNYPRVLSVLKKDFDKFNKLPTHRRILAAYNPTASLLATLASCRCRCRCSLRTARVRRLGRRDVEAKPCLNIIIIV